jgi:hypothetical protein
MYYAFLYVIDSMLVGCNMRIKAYVGSHIQSNMFQMQQIILFGILTCTVSYTCR